MATGQGSPHLPVRKTLIYDIHTKVFGFRIDNKSNSLNDYCKNNSNKNKRITMKIIQIKIEII